MMFCFSDTYCTIIMDCLFFFPLGLPRWLSGKESSCQCRRCKRCGFDPWVGKIPWRRKWKPIPVFLAWKIPWTEEPGGLVYVITKSWTGLSMKVHVHVHGHARVCVCMHTHTHTHSLVPEPTNLTTMDL